MSRPTLVLALLVAPLLLALPPASAQQAEFSVTAAGDGIVLKDSTIDVTVSVRNDGVTPLTVALASTGDADVRYTPAQLTVLPTQTGASRATIWGNGTHRDVPLVLSARDTNGGAMRNASFTLRVRTLELAVAPSPLALAPGATGTAQLDVLASYDETVNASAVAVPAGWNVSVAPASHAVQANVTDPRSVTVTAPANASGRYDIALRANTSRGAARTLVLPVDVTSAASPTIDASYANVTRPDAAGNATADVFAHANVTDVVDFAVYAAPPGWNVTFAGGEANVSPAAPARTRVVIHVPDGAAPGVHGVNVSARLRTSGATAYAKVPIEVAGPASEQAPVLGPARIGATLARGTNDSYHVTIRNPNDGPRTYELSTQLPPGWWAFPPRNVTIEANATYGHELYVRAEADAADGAGTLIVRGHGTSATIPIDLRVANASSPPSDHLWISPPTLSLPFFEGENKTRSVLLDAGNNASTSVEYAITLSLPDGWNASVSPLAGTLAPGGRVQLNVSVTHLGGQRAELGVKIADATSGDVSWIDLRPPEKTLPTPTPTPVVVPTPVEANVTPLRRLVPSEIVLAAGGSATATFHSPTEAGPLRLVLPASLGADTLLLRMAPDLDGGWSATFVLSASATAEAGPVSGARIEGVGEPFAIPVRIVAGVVPAARLDGGPEAASGPGAALVVAGSAAAVGGGTLGVMWAHKRWGAAFAALYTRLAPSQVLQHPVRRRMTEAISAEPGIAVGELQKRLGLSNGVIAHHLHRLERTGAVVSMMDGQWRRLYPVGLKPGTGGTLPQRALRALEGRGAVPASDLAHELGVSRQALHYHLKKLAQEGRIKATVTGGVLKVELAQA